MTENKRDEAGFESAAKKAAKIVLSSEKVKIIGHIDADGITASSIANMCLKRAGIDSEVIFAKKLDDQVISMVNSQDKGLTWLVDLGSGSYSKFDKDRVVVTDHHRPDNNLTEELLRSDGHVNPHLFGMDGSTENEWVWSDLLGR